MPKHDAARGIFRRRIAGERRDLDCGDGLHGLAARDGEDPRLVSARGAPRALSAVEARALCGSRGCVTKLCIAHLGLAHGEQKLDGDLIRDEFVLGQLDTGRTPQARHPRDAALDPNPARDIDNLRALA